MKNSIDFIKSELKNLHNKFLSSSIRYEFCNLTNIHIIEITPFDLYNSELYMNNELAIEALFAKQFPKEELIFVSEMSLTKISNPFFEILAQKIGRISTDFIEQEIFLDFIYDFENEYEFQSAGENNFALAA